MSAETKYRDAKVFNPAGPLPTPVSPASNYTLVKTNNERRNLVLRTVKEYIQTSE